MNLAELGLKGILWHLGGRYATTLIIFLIGLVLARLLNPADYGLVGMLTIFLAISNSFVDSGFNSALIQKENPTQEDYSTVFFFNLVIATILYLALYLAAPAIAAFYEAPLLTEITRVVAFSLVINGLYITQRTVLTKKVDFKTQTKITVPASLLAGIIAIIMAYYGLGVWALVANIIITALYTCLAMWHYCHWLPTAVFSKKSFSELFHFGSKVLLSGLLSNIYNNLHSLIIGKVFSPAQLGFYTKANAFAALPSQNTSIALSSVTMPIYSKLQRDDEKLQEEALKYLRFSTFFIFPVILGLAAISKPLIILLLTEKWAPAAPLLTILCFGYMWHHIQTIDQNVMLAKGFSQKVLQMELLKKGLGLTLLIISVPYGVKAMCWAFAVSYLFAFILGLVFAKKVAGLAIGKQLKALAPIFITALSMFLVVKLVIAPMNNPWLQLLAGISSGIFCYIIGSRLLCRREFMAIWLKIVKKRNVND